LFVTLEVEGKKKNSNQKFQGSWHQVKEFSI
jgi:hypothetical protein